MAKRENVVRVPGGRSRNGAGSAINGASSSAAAPDRVAANVERCNALIVGTSLGFRGGRFDLALEVLLASGARYRLAASMNGLEEGRKLQYLADLIDAVGMEIWEELPQQYCRVVVAGGRVISIGDILSDRWTDLPEFVRCEAL